MLTESEAGVSEEARIYENSVVFVQFCWESETDLKNKFY